MLTQAEGYVGHVVGAWGRPHLTAVGDKIIMIIIIARRMDRVNLNFPEGDGFRAAPSPTEINSCLVFFFKFREFFGARGRKEAHLVVQSILIYLFIWQVEFYSTLKR